MATTFTRKGSAVLVTMDGNVYSVPANSVIMPNPRNENWIFICDEYNPQAEAEGLQIDIRAIETPVYTDRNDLITKLTEQFFFDHVITTPLGGLAIAITNGTGAPSVKGMLVSVSTTTDNVFIAQTNEFDTFGIVYESGVADGAKCYVVIAGIAEVLVKNTVAVTRGHVAIAADTDGRMISIAVPSSNPVAAEHFKEIGHVMESKTAGTNVLAKCIIHFN